MPSRPIAHRIHVTRTRSKGRPAAVWVCLVKGEEGEDYVALTNLHPGQCDGR